MNLSFISIGRPASGRLVFRPIYTQVSVSHLTGRGGGAPERYVDRDYSMEARERIKRDDDMILQIVVAAVTKGMLH